MKSALLLLGFGLVLSAQAAAPSRFQFGAVPPTAGCIQVAAAAAYSPQTGYGFEPGTALGSDRPVSFSVAEPEGNYRVTVTLGDPRYSSVTTVKAEARRLMVESCPTSPGEFVIRRFLVNVRGPQLSNGEAVNLDSRERNPSTGEFVTRTWDDKLTLTFSGSHPSVAALEIEPVKDALTVFIVGDSTVTDQPRGPGSSWGQMVTRWFKPKVVVANHAESGETLKGFLKERRWAKVLDSIKPGDWVLIEFGTNDSKSRGPQNIYPNQDFSETYAPAATTYRELLKRFASDVEKLGAHPIIVSPSARRGDHALPSSLAAYAAAALATARELGIPSIDLNTMGVELNAALGADAARQFGDQTHHVEYGSYLQAKCIVEGIKQAGVPLAKFIVDDFGDFDPRHPEPTAAHFALPPDQR